MIEKFERTKCPVPVKALFIYDTLNLALHKYFSHYPKLGPGFRGLSGKVLASALVTHRLTKGYEIPSVKLSSSRKRDSIATVLERDTQGFEYIPPIGVSQGPGGDRYLQARRIINAICRHFKPTYSLVFPTGEGATTSHGRKDLYYKLESTRYWECSPQSFPYVARIFYGNTHMKRLVKGKFYELVKEELSWTRAHASAWLYRKNGKRGFNSFKTMLSYLVTLRDTSRMTTVPKDNSKDRVITCEPLLTMICQLSVMRDMRRALAKATGLDLTVMQDWHGAKLRMGHATIDFKNASNQVWLSVVRDMIPDPLRGILLALRTGVTEYNGQYHHFNMFSPMGCGLTFDVMTLLLLGVSRSFDANATVFGDDVMMKADVAQDFCEFIRKFGFEINTSKTFTEGNFRESCGHFADLTNDTLIKSFDLKRPSNTSEHFAAINKLRVIIDANQVTPSLRRLLLKTWYALLETVPRDALRGSSQCWVESTHVLIYNAVNLRYSADWQSWYQHVVEYHLVRPVNQDSLVEGVLDTVRMLRLEAVVPESSEELRIRRIGKPHPV